MSQEILLQWLEGPLTLPDLTKNVTALFNLSDDTKSNKQL